MINRTRFGIIVLLATTALLLPLESEALPKAMTDGDSNLQPYVTERPPSPKDDITKGYSVGNFWQYHDLQWILQYNSSGYANWQVQENTRQPSCNAVTACTAAYGVYLLNSSYAGDAFQVTRFSDSTTLNVGFIHNAANWAIVDNFCAGTTCGISILYDQSGNGHHLTQVSQNSMPRIYGDIVGNNRSITFDRQIGNTGLRSLGNTSLPVSNRQNFTVAMIMQSFISGGSDGYNSAGNVYFELGNPTTAFTLYNNSSPQNGLVYTAGTITGSKFNGFVLSSPEVMTVTDNSGSLTITNNNFSLTDKGVTSASATGLTLGNSLLTPHSNGSFDFVSMVVYKSALSSANLSSLQGTLYRDSGINPQLNDNIVLIGDSITRGYCPSCSHTVSNVIPWANQLQKILKRPFNFMNLGQGGETTAEMVNDSGFIAAHAFIPNANNIAVIFGGTNDLAGSGSITASDVYSNIRTLCSTYKAAGFKCIIATPLPRLNYFGAGQTASGFETKRQALISLMQKGWPGFADGIVNTGSNPVTGPQSAADNAALFDGNDKTHPTALGDSYITSDFVTGLNPVIGVK